ncbi:MAG: DUF3168 domain-containing protein [Betaproteobacteria bacterium]|nr:DUF3168 domain-containing protein [Betaproteobacteria bacterium]
MSVADFTIPDPVTLVRELLTETSEVTALVSTRILARTGPALPSRPFVRLDLAGGSPVDDRYLDVARIQVHVFGDDETDVATLTACRTVRAALIAATAGGVWVGDTGIITKVEIESGPALFHDPTHNPPLVDATFSAAVYIRP